MADPLVCAIMLTRDRPAMAARAVAAFRAQTYANKRLFIYDNGEEGLSRAEADNFRDDQTYWHAFWNAHRGHLSIGTLRNEANRFCERSPDKTIRYDAQIIVHWDDDDVSHPSRIAEQVALLQASGKECVGYRECLFCKEKLKFSTEGGQLRNETVNVGEAWLYHNADPRRALGASLCYWRRVWEKRPFPDLPKTRNGTAEDTEWLKGVDSLGITALAEPVNYFDNCEMVGSTPWCGLAKTTEPRLICSIHAKNSTDYDPAGLVRNGSPNWKRVPEWDDYARKVCAL